jgi:uncharacterized protein (DUF1778 family)
MYIGQMPRESKNDELEQVATRVTNEAHRVLEIAAAAERKSMTELLRPAVERYADELAQEPEIIEMLDQARKYEARKKGVKLLPQKNRPARGRSSGRSSASR